MLWIGESPPKQLTTVSNTITKEAMPNNNNNRRYVVSNPDGGWDVKKENAGRASQHFDRQADAEKRAKEIVHNAGGGQVQIQGRNGRWRDGDTVKPGNDPFPPRDKKH